MPENVKLKAILNSATVMILKEVAEINGKYRKQEFRTRHLLTSLSLAGAGYVRV
jgi:hypothetical protein